MKNALARTMLLAVVAGGLNLAAFAPAEAQVSPVANGRRCGFASVTDPTVEGGDTQTGQINGGPLVAAAAGATVELTCTIQVGIVNSTHSGADAVAVTGAATVQVAVVPATHATYVSPTGQPVYLCTHVIINGNSYYWDASANGGSGDWSVNAGAATCNQAISQQLIPQPIIDLLEQQVFPLLDFVIGFVFDNVIDPAFDAINDILIDHVDPALCAELAAQTGGPADTHPWTIDETGDPYFDFDGDGQFTHPDELFWDCPPYTFR